MGLFCLKFHYCRALSQALSHTHTRTHTQARPHTQSCTLSLEHCFSLSSALTSFYTFAQLNGEKKSWQVGCKPFFYLRQLVEY